MVRNRLVVAALSASAMLGACSADASFRIGGESVEDAAAELIETEITEQVGLDLDANCPTVENPEVGTEFTCTASTDDGRTVEFDGVVDRENHIDLKTTNLINAEVLAAFEASAADKVEQETGVAVTVDCGDSAVVLDSNDEMTCSVEGGGSVRDLILTVPEPNTGQFNLRME